MPHKFSFVLATFIAFSVNATADGRKDGDWQLRINGHHDFVFGDFRLAGWLRLPWQVDIRFTVAEGEWLNGTGKSRWSGQAQAYSQPNGWIDCKLLRGTFLDGGMNLRETPHMRYPGFPVGGQVNETMVTLQPGYQEPWNYLAVTYTCKTDNALADNWFMFADRAKQELGKRQDAETNTDGNQRKVSVREVVVIPPEGPLTIPLQHGWSFTQGGSANHQSRRFRLTKLGD